MDEEVPVPEAEAEEARNNAMAIKTELEDLADGTTKTAQDVGSGVLNVATDAAEKTEAASSAVGSASTGTAKSLQ